MWVDERVFSKGDLCEGVKGDKYSEYIEYEYNNNLAERLEHVEKMIERLEAERKMLEEELSPDPKLTPSPNGCDCLGNGTHPEYECCCDECDFFLECFPD